MQGTDSTWPAIIYGTAWKGAATAPLVRQALEAGYRALDTANQPRHYHEAGVGEALARALPDLGLARAELFLQTKFTPPAGHGEQIPYDPAAAPEDQVAESLRGSLSHLGTDYLDSYLLHAPQDPRGLTDTDWRIWAAMETAQQAGTVRRIGVSNAGAAHLRELLANATVAPAAVQNRCFARSGWDREVRMLCRERGICYQGFSLLTANPQVLEDSRVHAAAEGHTATPAQIVFAFARAIGMVPLTGTTDAGHMAEDLAALDITLEPTVIGQLGG